MRLQGSDNCSILVMSFFLYFFRPPIFLTSLSRFRQNFATWRGISWNSLSFIGGVFVRAPKKFEGQITPISGRFADPKSTLWTLPFPNARKIGKSKTIGSISIPNMVGLPPPTSENGCFLGVWDRAGKFWMDVTSAVWQLATCYLILLVGFWGQAIQWRHSQDRGSKERCHSNQFWD